MPDKVTALDPVNEIYTDPQPILDVVRMQIAFWEKLVVLDAAILAASFTAIGIFHSHQAGDGGMGYLAAAWKLLFYGLALCLLAQWIAIPGALTIIGHRLGMRVLSLLNQSATDALNRGERLSTSDVALSSEIVKTSSWLFKKGDFLSRLAGVLGSAGLISSIGSLYWLYRFAHANLVSFYR